MVVALHLPVQARVEQITQAVAEDMGNILERLWNSAVSDNPHVAHTGDLVLQVLSVTVAGSRSGSGRRTPTDPPAFTHQLGRLPSGTVRRRSSPCPSTLTDSA